MADLPVSINFTASVSAGTCTTFDVTAPGAEVVQSGPNATVSFCGPGEYTVRVRGCNCAATTITVRVRGVDLDIDSDNNNGTDDPSRSCDEERIEMNAPGKILFTGDGDSDADGFPDWYDGLDITTNNPSYAPMIPIVIDLGPYRSYPDVRVNLQYPASGPDPLDVFLGGFLRIWTHNANGVRRAASVLEGGDFVPNDTLMTAQQIGLVGGRVTLWVEAVQPSFDAGDLTIILSASGVNESCVVDWVTLTAAEIVAHDMQAWSPDLGVEGGVVIAEPDPYAFVRVVDGAITDGASPCIFRVNPRINPAPAIRVKMAVADRDFVDRAASFGAFLPAPIAGTGTFTMPALPLPFEAGGGGGLANEGVMPPGGDGNAIIYVPPEAYLDITRSPSVPPQFSLGPDEFTPMNIRVELGGSFVGIQRFELRRPPIVLIHGIMSNPATWASPMWTEGGGGAVPTRMYKVNWSGPAAPAPIARGTAGYSENVAMLSAVIHEAIEDYRLGRDLSATNYGGRAFTPPDPRGFQAKRYAATRLDVVGHSQGGQITRLYLSDVSSGGTVSGYSRDGAPVTPPPRPPINAGGAVWPSFHIVRGLTPTNGQARWNLRADNFLSGDIRRFLPLGSPFKGSDYANALEPWLRPTFENERILGLAREFMSASMDAMLFDLSGSYIEPTCACDLQVGSPAQGLLETASYPDPQIVAWTPIVGIATVDVATDSVQGVLWELLFRMVGFVDEWDVELSPRNPTNGDLIVGQFSQRNASGSGDARASTGQVFFYTAHVPVLNTLSGETESAAIGTAGQAAPQARSVSELLSGSKSLFNGGGLAR